MKALPQLGVPSPFSPQCTAVVSGWSEHVLSFSKSNCEVAGRQNDSTSTVHHVASCRKRTRCQVKDVDASSICSWPCILHDGAGQCCLPCRWIFPTYEGGFAQLKVLLLNRVRTGKAELPEAGKFGDVILRINGRKQPATSDLVRWRYCSCFCGDILRELSVSHQKRWK